MKTIVLLGLLCLLLTVAHNRVVGTSSHAAQSTAGPTTMQAPAVRAGSEKLPARLAEYVFLHQTDRESASVHTLAAVNTCPE